MPELTRRLQILLDEERYARLEQTAERSNRSVAAVVRTAIDLAFPSGLSREEAGDVLLDAAAMPVDDWEQMRDEVRGRHRTAASADVADGDGSPPS